MKKYAVLTNFDLGPGNGDVADKIGDETCKIVSKFEGFVDLVLIGDYGTGAFGGLSIWDNQEAAEAAFNKMRPMLSDGLNQTQLCKSPMSMRILEIYDPKVE